MWNEKAALTLSFVGGNHFIAQVASPHSEQVPPTLIYVVIIAAHEYYCLDK